MIQKIILLICRLVTALVVLAGMLLALPPAGSAAAPKKDLTALGLEDLMNVEVMSASKKVQRLSDTAAAAFVITQEDMRRSGATSIADALRLAPGVDVARIDANKWAVSIRGFNGRFSNKLLVLMDGRSLYTPLFSGVFWDVQDTMLEDIDRIEVIRGPGAALWGANAINGVINIITKSAESTKGGLVSAGAGTTEKGFASARYGMKLSEKTDFRLYAKNLHRGSGVDASGNDTHDSWQTSRGGFRLDARATERDTLTFQGDYYDGTIGETYGLYSIPTLLNPTRYRVANTDTGVRGGNLLSRWQRKFSDTDELSFQAYYDRTEREMVIATEKRDTLDLEFQHRLQLGSRNNLIWGLGYRFSHDDISRTAILSFDPLQKGDQLFSAFLHDEITLVPERMALILGSRFEQNDYSGFEVQPNGRLLYTPTPQHTLWLAVSRAVRTPSRGDFDIQYNHSVLPPPIPPPVPFPLNQLPTQITVYGSRNFQSLELLSYELGYRTEPIPHVSLDMAAFYNEYSNLRTLRTGAPSFDSLLTPTYMRLPFVVANDLHGRTYGAEVSLTWAPMPWWRLQASYSYLQMKMMLDNGSNDLLNRDGIEGSNPQNQFSLRSSFDVGRQVEMDLWLRGVDRLPFAGAIGSIPGYVTGDVRLAWKPLKNLELSLVGQNLLHTHNQEFYPELINTLPSEVSRSFYGKITWNFGND